MVKFSPTKSHERFYNGTEISSPEVAQKRKSQCEVLHAIIH